MKTIKELAQEAIDVQNACNLSGVVNSFGRAMSELRQIAEVEGWISTDKLNQHPVAVLYADKIASLTGQDFAKAYSWAMDITNKI